jgi:DNA-binding transcriptional MerR regulator
MTDSAMLAFTTDEAQRLTGLSARRLQYWDETDFIRPAVAARQGRGWPRLYSFRDLVQLCVAAQLRDPLSLQALRRLKDALDTEAPFATVRFARQVEHTGESDPDGREPPRAHHRARHTRPSGGTVELQIHSSDIECGVHDWVAIRRIPSPPLLAFA